MESVSQLFNRKVPSVAFSSRFRATFDLVALKTARKHLGNVTDSPNLMMQTPPQPSILIDYEITPSTQVAFYPLLEDFLAKLDLLEPHRGWTTQFLIPLRSMGVTSLDDMDLVTPESLYVFFRLPPIAIMDLFAHVDDTIQRIHCQGQCGYGPSMY